MVIMLALTFEIKKKIPNKKKDFLNKKMKKNWQT